MSTEKLIKELVDAKQFGTLQHAFILEAIREYTQKILEMPAPKNDRGVISFKLWSEIADTVNKTLKDPKWN
jgi:hypothetical protein